MEIIIIILILFIGLLPWLYTIFKYIIKKTIKYFIKLRNTYQSLP